VFSTLPSLCLRYLAARTTRRAQCSSRVTGFLNRAALSPNSQSTQHENIEPNFIHSNSSEFSQNVFAEWQVSHNTDLMLS
jgi:hypothetical protein